MGKKIIRLQGNDWKRMESELTVRNYMVSSNYHIKGIYEGTDGKTYSHWLSDTEIQEFIEKILEELKCK